MKQFFTILMFFTAFNAKAQDFKTPLNIELDTYKDFEYGGFTATNPPAGDLVINEFMASNKTAVADQDGEFDDWIELYNNGDTTIDLEGFFLSDDAENLLLWPFPAGTSIAAGEYLMVWADKDELQVGLHADLKLSALGESLFLVYTDGVIEDEVTFGEQMEDVSYGRFPNGTGDFRLMSPSFNAENLEPFVVNTRNIVADVDAINVSPNPATELLFIEVDGLDQTTNTLFIYDLNGKVVYTNQIINSLEINVIDWPAGMYFAKVGPAYSKIFVK